MAQEGMGSRGAWGFRRSEANALEDLFRDPNEDKLRRADQHPGKGLADSLLLAHQWLPVHLAAVRAHVGEGRIVGPHEEERVLRAHAVVVEDDIAVLASADDVTTPAQWMNGPRSRRPGIYEKRSLHSAARVATGLDDGPRLGALGGGRLRLGRPQVMSRLADDVRSR